MSLTDEPWLSDPLYGGMTPKTAKKSYEAAKLEMADVIQHLRQTEPQKDETRADEKGNSEKKTQIRATPYRWKDPKTITPRDWLYGKTYIRKYVTCTVAPGATGKTSKLVVEALAMTSCKALLGIAPPRPLKVWLINLEDPQEEAERKIQAAALYYGLKPEDFCSRLFTDSGRDQQFVIAEATKSGVVIVKPVVEARSRPCRKSGSITARSTSSRTRTRLPGRRGNLSK
jgi:hypothetical protein